MERRESTAGADSRHKMRRADLENLGRQERRLTLRSGRLSTGALAQNAWERGAVANAQRTVMNSEQPIRVRVVADQTRLGYQADQGRRKPELRMLGQTDHLRLSFLNHRRSACEKATEVA